jgi:hypothetical protein
MNESEIARRIEQVFRDEEQKRKSNRWDVIDFFAAFLLASSVLLILKKVLRRPPVV